MTASHPDDRCFRCGQAGHKSHACKNWPACTDCAAALLQAAWGGFHAACKGCAARMLASGLPYWQSAKAKALQPAYVAALKATFGDDWQAGHDQVKGWAKRMEAAC